MGLLALLLCLCVARAVQLADPDETFIAEKLPVAMQPDAELPRTVVFSPAEWEYFQARGGREASADRALNAEFQVRQVSNEPKGKNSVSRLHQVAWLAALSCNWLSAMGLSDRGESYASIFGTRASEN